MTYHVQINWSNVLMLVSTDWLQPVVFDYLTWFCDKTIQHISHGFYKQEHYPSYARYVSQFFGHDRSETWESNNHLLTSVKYSVETAKSIKCHKLKRWWVIEWICLPRWQNFSWKSKNREFLLECGNEMLTSNQNFCDTSKQKWPACQDCINTTTNVVSFSE